MVAQTELSDDQIDRVFHALATATRRDILRRTLEREQSVSALAADSGVVESSPVAAPAASVPPPSPQTGGTGEPTDSSPAAAGAHSKAYSSDTECPSAETTCHCTV